MISHTKGFSLLEAIVALVILSMTAIALYGWQNTNLFTMRRAEAHAASNELTRSALSVVETINPMLTPSGDRSLGSMEMHWVATPIQPVKPGVTAVGLPGLFDLGLYNVDVVIKDDAGVALHFTVRQVGYKQTRFPEKEL